MPASEAISLFLGAGGVAVLTLVFQALKDRRAGKLASEDTAITRWKDLADERAKELREVQAYLDAYRECYGPLWAAYMSKSGPKETFPPNPKPRREVEVAQ